MTSIINNDLFCYLRNSENGINYDDTFLNFVIQHLNVRLSETAENKLKTRLRLFCTNLRTRWHKCRRNLKTFEAKYKSWLTESFEIADNSIVNPAKLSSTLLQKKPFSEVSNRHKRRLIQILREENSGKALLIAAKLKLASEGFSDLATVIDHLINHPNDIKRVRDFCENKIETLLL